MSLFKQFATNKDLETNGVEVQYGENDDKTVPTFIISRMSSSNKKYNKAIENATRPYRRMIDMNIMPNEQAEKILQKVFIDVILIGWKNVQDEQNKPIDFNSPNALMLFDKLPDLYADLKVAAQTAALFRAECLEEEAKN
jgi:hypothetical protein